MQNNDIIAELGKNFIEYAVACNTDRSIPDAKSGLKPVAKRILWSAFEEGRTFNKPHVKCARIVGDVMGKYHPHGDSSIYGAMTRLSQSWVMRYPLIDWHGSNGNISGDGAAAMRYTEARLSKITEDGLLSGIKKKNVDFIPNFDETLKEPITLPAIFPNLLCNPNMGIGVAMACNWLPHNLGEVANAIYDYIEGKEPTLPGPDFPTGGTIINSKDVPQIMKTGHGSVKVRGKYKIEKNNIVFYEIPYGTTVEGLLTEIGKLCDDEKEFDEIIDLRDETNKKGVRIVICCDKKADLDAVAQKLFMKTDLQLSISYNQVALLDKVPTELNLKDCCKIYIDHNVDCLIKELNFDLIKINDRLHIIDGLLIALEDIDNVIHLIKTSKNSADAKSRLIEKYSLSEKQAKAILDMRLSSLAKLEKIELETEKKELETKKSEIEIILKDKSKQIAEIRNRLQNLVNKYGDKRKTELLSLEIPKKGKEVPVTNPEDVVITITKSGQIKKIPSKSFKVQKRNTKGTKANNEAILSTLKTNTADIVMFFSDKGKLYRTIADTIPTTDNKSKGVSIHTLVKLNENEKIIAITSLHKENTPKYVFFVTKKGYLKKTLLKEYLSERSRNSGIAATKLKDDDSIANIFFQDDEDIVLLTKKGMSLRIKSKDVSQVGRIALGVKGIKLNDDDEVVAALPVHKETDCLGIFASNGLGKKIGLSDISQQNTNTKGTNIYKTDNSVSVVAGLMISDEDNILINTSKNTLCISAQDISKLSKTASGTIMAKSPILSVTKI